MWGHRPGGAALGATGLAGARGLALGEEGLAPSLSGAAACVGPAETRAGMKGRAGRRAGGGRGAWLPDVKFRLVGREVSPHSCRVPPAPPGPHVTTRTLPVLPFGVPKLYRKTKAIRVSFSGNHGEMEHSLIWSAPSIFRICWASSRTFSVVVNITEAQRASAGTTSVVSET